MKNTNLFQYIVIGAFIFFIVVGAILFATYKSSSQTSSNISVTIWGTLPSDDFSGFVSSYFNDVDLKYKVNYVSKDKKTFDRELVEALASGAGPDAIIMPTDLIVNYRNKIYPIPYTTLSELDFKNTFIQEGELYLDNNGILALPFSVDPLVMYWNRNIFNNVSVAKAPVTWPEVLTLAPKIIKKDQAKNLSRQAVALGEFRNVNNAKAILGAMIIQNVEKFMPANLPAAGTPIVSFDKASQVFTSTLKDDFGAKANPSISALGYYTKFSNPSLPEYSWNRSLPNSLDAFINGDLAMYFGFASEFVNIKNKNPNLNLDVSFFPQLADTKIYGTFGNMLGLAIMKNSKDPASTYAVLSALTSAEAFPYWKSIFNVPSARRDILAQTEKNAIKTIFNRSALMSKGWFDPGTAETDPVFQEMIEAYTTGREDIESAVNSASDRLDLILSQ